MPFIIWGWRGVPSQLDVGEFFCPQCNCECEYRLMQSRTFFTIFFIPLIPLGRGERYVECTQCRQTYLEARLFRRTPRPRASTRRREASVEA